MKELFQQWIEARLSVQGMIACGVASGDAPPMCVSADPKFPAEKMAEIIRQLRSIGPLPGVDPATVRWHTWLYANGKIRAAVRPDGWFFAAAVRANSDAAQILNPLTHEFQTLKPAEASPAEAPQAEAPN